MKVLPIKFFAPGRIFAALVATNVASLHRRYYLAIELSVALAAALPPPRKYNVRL
ncbi:hypothetical protein [Lacisediminimonas sp.]|uniref:hypothetical protein n=1 Tax=Lacisediminimonas sp. TaxID=3060582 RepID=UPI002721F672|nr:hypothetical protein [Lacisediminimonas sp.]MDO8298558.1 hypothetical protein [Lacisediminimonas sp.]